MCKDKEFGVATLEEAMGHIEKAIIARGGTFAVKSKPTFVQKDDKKEGSDESGSESGSSSEEGENEDETMGKFDADFTDLMKKAAWEGIAHWHRPKCSRTAWACDVAR